MEEVRRQGFLGSDAFVEQMVELAERQSVSSEVPRKARPVLTLRAIEHDAESRDQAIRRAYATGGYTLAEIGAHFGLHYSMISRIVRGRVVGKQRRQVAGDSK